MGPRTPEGKAICSQNALRHGFTAGFGMMGPEDRAQYGQLLAQLHADHKPATVLEAMLLERMAEHHWLIQRAIRFQNNFFEGEWFIAENFNAFIRYQVTNERAFSRALADLLKLNKESLKEEIGSVSQNRPAPTEQRDSPIFDVRHVAADPTIASEITACPASPESRIATESVSAPTLALLGVTALNTVGRSSRPPNPLTLGQSS